MRFTTLYNAVLEPYQQLCYFLLLFVFFPRTFLMQFTSFYNAVFRTSSTYILFFDAIFIDAVRKLHQLIVLTASVNVFCTSVTNEFAKNQSISMIRLLLYTHHTPQYIILALYLPLGTIPIGF